MANTTASTFTLTLSGSAPPAIRDITALVDRARELGIDLDCQIDGAHDPSPNGHLVLTVGVDEPVTVGDSTVTVRQLRGNRARVAFHAPRHVRIARGDAGARTRRAWGRGASGPATTTR